MSYYKKYILRFTDGIKGVAALLLGIGIFFMIMP